MTNYLEVTNLSKSFDSFQLHNISFTLPKGYIMGLIGPNGSGKTTTIKLILNMLKRTGGTVKVMGLDNIAEEQKVKSELGVVFDTNYFSDDWKVSQVGAEDDFRSVNGQIEYLLTECVRQRKKNGKYVSDQLDVPPELDLH